MEYRTEHDTLGEIAVPADRLWGAVTERSRRNFSFSEKERMPKEMVRAIALIKIAAAEANRALLPDRMTAEKADAIREAAWAVARGEYDEEFPLVVFQTGSGTQTNMNVNEVVAHIANRAAGCSLLHPNDDVNMSQSSNDVFPSAIHLSAILAVEDLLLPRLSDLCASFRALEEKYAGVLKCARTHLQDAVPMYFSDEISGWRSSLERDADLIRSSLVPLSEVALGATAVGTGLNAPEGFGEACAENLSALTGKKITRAENLFHALTSKDEIIFAHGALKALAADLFKIANDIRHLASGPRTGLGEITIPANEPGSSIMPGKVNPTQCESVTMAAIEVMANDTAIGMAASQGNFELNVFMPLIAADFLRSVDLLAGAIIGFDTHLVRGIEVNSEKMQTNVDNSLMLATCLNPVIGYEKAAQAVKYAYANDTSLKDACAALGLLSPEEFERVCRPETMAGKGNDK